MPVQRALGTNICSLEYLRSNSSGSNGTRRSRIVPKDKYHVVNGNESTEYSISSVSVGSYLPLKVPCIPKEKIHTTIVYPSTSPGGDQVSGRSRADSPCNDSISSRKVKRELGDSGTDLQSRLNQQRLLLLLHASKCTKRKGECSFNPHCAKMRPLWKHISVCLKKDCPAPHCMSSRRALSHHRRCKDSECLECAPVKVKIRKAQDVLRSEDCTENETSNYLMCCVWWYQYSCKLLPCNRAQRIKFMTKFLRADSNSIYLLSFLWCSLLFNTSIVEVHLPSTGVSKTFVLTSKLRWKSSYNL